MIMPFWKIVPSLSLFVIKRTLQCDQPGEEENCRYYRLVLLAISPVFSKNVLRPSAKKISLEHFGEGYISFLLILIEFKP